MLKTTPHPTRPYVRCFGEYRLTDVVTQKGHKAMAVRYVGGRSLIATGETDEAAIEQWERLHA